MSDLICVEIHCKAHLVRFTMYLQLEHDLNTVITTQHKFELHLLAKTFRFSRRYIYVIN